jgi:hypothetical protein
LISLRDWQLAHPQARPFYLTYSGVTDPELYNIVEDVLPQRLSKELREFASRLPPGWYAISANHLHGYDAPESPWTGFLALAPIDRAGYSIFIYHIPEQAP